MCDWQTQYKIQYTHYWTAIYPCAVVNFHISEFRDKMSLARDTGHRGSIPGRSRPFWDGWQALSSNENENYVAHVNELSIRKKAPKTASKSTHKPSHNICLNYVPHAQADQAWHTKSTNFRSYCWHARSSISGPQTLHADRERRDNSKRCQSFFDLAHSFSSRGKNADFGHWCTE